MMARTLIPITCQLCSATRLVKPYRAYQKPSRFCSNSCWSQWRWMQRHQTGQPGIGRTTRTKSIPTVASERPGVHNATH